MDHHHFISYSPVNALDFAIHLCDALEAGPPSYHMWLDKRELKPGQDWDTQVAEAISTCDSLLFVMTPDSVEDQSVCKPERKIRPYIPSSLCCTVAQNTLR